ncbi:hypothetical protein jhhlp_001186 [Lomentospora prolificans]|uniref:RRM domain-containing protein n=1 Tax=Lomentospora prolificans TaxID=41688 RepID=A0A2N3NHR9_9PEZI|nr:hypothetical protein jhhlp_001186 [Lomentospora prolificans]
MAPSPNSKKRQRDIPAVEDPALQELIKADTIPETDDRVSKRQRVEGRRSLFVRSLPPSATNESLTEFFSQHFPVKHSTVVIDQKTKESRGYGFVTFADPDDAKEAQEKLDKVEWEGRRLRLEVAEPRNREKGAEGQPPVDSEKAKRQALLEEARRPAKLIIRNLPWSVKKPEHLSKIFMSFGKIRYTDLPNTNGKLKGFGFVTFRKRAHAEKAKEKINGKEVDGRKLEVDWAIDKKIYEQQGEANEPELKHEKKKDEKKDEKKKDEKMKGDKKAEATKKSADTGPSERERTPTADEDLRNFLMNHIDDLESESDQDDLNEEELDIESDPENEDDEMDDEAGSDLDDDDNDKDGGASVTKKSNTKQLMTDNSSTVFVRNLPYTATDEQLKSFFFRFGPIRYARVVMEKATGRAAGTGFVCFVNQEDCKACIRNAPRHEPKQINIGGNLKHSILHDESVDPGGKYTLDGRVLQVAQAVSKEEAGKFAEGQEKSTKDKRRLFLLSEGQIDQRSPLYNLLAPAEVKMREASLAQRKKLVQGNPTLHLSLTRLAVRNIPRNIGPKELKELARKAIVGFAVDVKEGRRQPLSKEEIARGGEEERAAEHQRKLKNKGVVKQAKLIFETTDGSKAPVEEGGRSRGYGFIEYWSHRNALMGLRYLNGHQLEDDRGKKQRLIVEFAIENAQVVNRRKALEAKSRDRTEVSEETAPNGADKAAGKNFKGPASNREKGKKGAKGADRVRGRQGEKETNSRGGQSKEERVQERKDNVKQQLIGRKRMIRKKKASARG